jgi:hypothetical protein
MLLKTAPLTTELRNEQSLNILTHKIEELKDIVIGQKEEITHLKNDVMATLSRIESYHLGSNYRGGDFNSTKSHNGAKFEDEIYLTNYKSTRSFKTNSTVVKSPKMSTLKDNNKLVESTKKNVEQISKLQPPKKHERPGLNEKFKKVMDSNF